MTQPATAPTRRTRWGLLAVAVVCVTTSAAFANPGTAVIWPILLLFLFGNLIIGVIEWIGLAIAGAHRWRAAIMIPANYASGFVGLQVVGGIDLDPYLQGIDLITNLHAISIIGYLLLVVLGIIVEIPFMLLAFRSPRNWRRMLRALVVVNAITGLGVGVYYTFTYNISLATYRAVTPAAIAADVVCDDAWIQFHGPEGTVRMRPDGTERTIIALNERLEPEHPSVDPSGRMKQKVLDLRDEPGRSVEHWWSGILVDEWDVLQIAHPMLRSTEIKFVNVLPGDVVIFELGEDGIGKSRGIYAVSLRSRTVTFLGKGSAPVAMRTPPETPPGP